MCKFIETKASLAKISFRITRLIRQPWKFLPHSPLALPATCQMFPLIALAIENDIECHLNRNQMICMIEVEANPRIQLFLATVLSFYFKVRCKNNRQVFVWHTPWMASKLERVKDQSADNNILFFLECFTSNSKNPKPER